MNALNQHFEFLQLRLDEQTRGPTVIEGKPAEFTEGSRYVVQENIETLGILFPKLFPEAMKLLE